MKIDSGKLDKAPECKDCHKTLDGFTGDFEARPTDGDISICAYCGSIGEYASGCSEIKPLTVEELKQLRDDDPKMWKQLMSYKHIADSVRKKMNGVDGGDADLISGNSSIEIK